MVKKGKEIEKRMLGPSEVEERYPISKGTLANWRSAKRGPKYYKVGRKALYDVNDLEDFFLHNPVETIDSLKEKDNE